MPALQSGEYPIWRHSETGVRIVVQPSDVYEDRVVLQLVKRGLDDEKLDRDGYPMYSDFFGRGRVADEARSSPWTARTAGRIDGS